jgi:hypothetical protein
VSCFSSRLRCLSPQQADPEPHDERPPLGNQALCLLLVGHDGVPVGPWRLLLRFAFCLLLCEGCGLRLEVAICVSVLVTGFSMLPSADQSAATYSDQLFARRRVQAQPLGLHVGPAVAGRRRALVWCEAAQGENAQQALLRALDEPTLQPEGPSASAERTSTSPPHPVRVLDAQ